MCVSYIPNLEVYVHMFALMDLTARLAKLVYVIYNSVFCSCVGLCRNGSNSLA